MQKKFKDGSTTYLLQEGSSQIFARSSCNVLINQIRDKISQWYVAFISTTTEQHYLSPKSGIAYTRTQLHSDIMATA